jgi:hypothetical protein
MVDIYGENIAVDSDSGLHTYNAVRDVQGMLSIHVDGICGPQTRDHICWPDADNPDACIWLNSNH